MQVIQSFSLVVLLASPADSASCTEATHDAWLSGCYMLVGPSTPNDDSVDEDPGSPPRKGFWTQGDLVTEFQHRCLVAVERRDSPAFEDWADAWLTRVQLCDWSAHVEWLRVCYADVENLPGLTRSELLTKFEPAGYNSRHSRHFYHKSCDSLYIEVEFSVHDPNSTDGYLKDIVLAVEPCVGLFWQ